jgi:hypothetical protein
LSPNYSFCSNKSINRKNRREIIVKRGIFLPAPRVKKGKWSKERERTKSGRWRKKRSDANQPRKVKKSRKKSAAIVIGTIFMVVAILLIIYFYFPNLLDPII